MAFYNRKMAENKMLIQAWRAGHRRKLGSGEDINLPEICAEIAHWVRRDRRPRSRLSLRSFSVLISGTIRLYRDQVDLLLKDTFNLTAFNRQTMSKLASIPANQESGSSGDEDDESFVMMPDMFNTRNSSSHSNWDQSKLDEHGVCKATSEPGNVIYKDDTSDGSTVYTVTPHNKKTTEETQEKKERRDQIVQTSPTHEAMDCIEGFDPNLPFGYVLVHDNYYSRLPSKIVFSSLNRNINMYPSTK